MSPLRVAFSTENDIERRHSGALEPSEHAATVCLVKSATIRKRQHDIEAFVDALGRFLGTVEHHPETYTTDAAWMARPGQEAQAAQLRFQVDRFSGPAAHALASVGSHVPYKPRGAFEWQTMPVNPATARSTILNPDPMFGPDVILACCSQALGVLDMQGREAEERESRPFHRLRVRLPRAPRGWFTRHAGGLVKSAGGIVGALLVAFLTYWFGWT
jgi:hypothetical protein